MFISIFMKCMTYYIYLYCRIKRFLWSRVKNIILQKIFEKVFFSHSFLDILRTVKLALKDERFQIIFSAEF